MPASSRILSCNHGILSSTSYLPAARFCFPQEAPLFVENRSDSFQAIPHNSKCRYGERGAADAKPKAQIILDAAKVSAASGGNSEPKQGQRSQSARGFCPRSTMRVPQPDIIEHFGNADAVPQPPERCLELCGIAFIISALIGCKTAKRATALTDCGPTYYFMRCGY